MMGMYSYRRYYPIVSIDVEEQEAHLQRMVATYHSSTINAAEMDNVYNRMDDLKREFHHRPVDIRPRFQRLLCGYFQLTARVTRDQGYEHADVYYYYAHHLASGPEERATVARRLGECLHWMGKSDRARAAYEKAWEERNQIPESLRGSIMALGGLLHAQTARTDNGRLSAIKLLDRGGRLDYDPLTYHFWRMNALVAIGWNQDALDEVSYINNEGQLRRAAMCDLLMAEARFNRNEYDHATACAEAALPVARSIHSRYIIGRVQKLYDELYAKAVERKYAKKYLVDLKKMLEGAKYV